MTTEMYSVCNLGPLAPPEAIVERVKPHLRYALETAGCSAVRFTDPEWQEPYTAEDGTEIPGAWVLAAFGGRNDN